MPEEEEGESSFLASHTTTQLHLLLQQPLLHHHHRHHHHLHHDEEDFSFNPPPPTHSTNYNRPPLIIFQDIVQKDPSSSSIIAAADEEEEEQGSSHLSQHRSHRKNKIHRCKTAPAMAVMREALKSHPPKPPHSASLLVQQAALLLLVYLSLGVLIYSFNRDHFSGFETHPVVDALYFCIVTMCTIGYGDIAPITPPAKLFACFFVLVGFGFIDVLLSGVVNYVLDLQESIILNANIKNRNHNHNTTNNCIIDVAKGRMRIRLKVCLALGVVASSIGMGTLVLYFVEGLDWIDSVYLSVMSVTTVGYGDRAFKTLAGRLFASIWLLFSTLAVARAFLYLAEARMHKRHRRITNWVLHREITVEDLLAADINNNGFISKSEYIIYKLKEMGKIGEKDILQICNQFNKLDRNNSGKITLPGLLEGRL